MRYRELDIARGFTVLMMPAVHCTMLYGNDATYQSWWGHMLNWVATMPGAQLFMLLMGMSLKLSGNKSPRATFLKMTRWCIVAYTLNFLKFIIPARAGWLPASFYASVSLLPGFEGSVRLFLIGDILQLAAISLGIVYILNRLEASITTLVALSAIIIFISPILWNIHFHNNFINEVASSVTGNDPLAFFPVFPWLLYPIMGFLLAKMLVQGRLQYRSLFFAGIALMLPKAILDNTGFSTTDNLYRPVPVQAIYHVGFCFSWVALCAFMSSVIKRSWIYSLLNFCSRHITLIYCVQWIAVFWCIAFVPYRGLSIMQTVGMSILISLFVFVFAYVISLQYNYALNRRQYG